MSTGSPRHTAAAPRNFTLSVEERVRAVVAGPPAFMRRKRHIEDLEESIARGLVLLDRGLAKRPETLRIRLDRQLVQLNELIELHNRYYPAEANLRMDPISGEILEMGKPWSPLPPATFESLRAHES
ncbi:hypothetical protein LVJ94_01525 [Pendulispora rubella]|uniref:Uncharacterized protein n=1 Tax=Pendulispora rubella TaxID=2741070 RepID=A0ABZ2L4T1_9BACT